MINLKKISLQNFKGIKPKTIFNFDKEDVKVNILAGPNGFGKTTIFDVIEICLTGIFKSVDLFDTVQKKNNNKNKPFFQNVDEEDVILKLWLEDSITKINYIIIKHYDDDKSPTKINLSKDFIPAEASQLFTTYLTHDTSFFESDEFSNLGKVNQSKINELFFGEEAKIDLSSTFYLFSYIQQEDSIYFLRQTEDAKGASLGFLFNIEKEEANKSKIANLKSDFENQQATIKKEIDLLKDSLPETNTLEYVKIFSTRDFDFDRENPFKQLDEAKPKLNQFENIINSLIIFRNEFSIEEFGKSLKYKKLNEEIINNDAILNSLLFKGIYTAELIKQVETVNSKISIGTEFLKKQATALIERKYFDLFVNDEEIWNQYRLIEVGIESVDRDLGEIGKVISELNTEREKVLSTYTKLKEAGHFHDSENNCPLCNTTFESFENLQETIYTKGRLLFAYNDSKLDERNTLQAKIKEFYDRILGAVKQFLSQNKITDQSILSLLRNYSNTQIRIEEIFSEFIAFNSEEIKAFVFQVCPNTITEVNEKKLFLKDHIEQTILAIFRYNDSLIANKHFYSEYFNSSPELFTSITAEMLLIKAQYLRGKYAGFANDRLRFLEDRNRKLIKVISKIGIVHEKIHTTIHAHKYEMIEKIKIPFYIYSGKILQSYQQGLGIFVDIHPTGLSNNVRFKTGHKSDHDIVYHLSSGQMAVVSLAFCLSLNKVYNTNENFKFLSIDDPIQTMDDLNIHTFIELVRNEFSEYQIIMSTHDDFTSRYMKYKFDKFGMQTEIQNVQKLVLEQSI